MSAADFDYFILRCLCLGHTTRQIGSFTRYTQSRISQRVSAMCRRYGARSQAELVRKMRGAP